ncbi:hypothetical protein HDV06_003286 [Boothiomyces sp. JEL0866]|nr:hypothetical protein HDV06_003286 [Boothiomyces sp. JEL0866]
MSKNLNEAVEAINEIQDFIQEYSWLSDFFAIDFLTTDYWSNRFPEEWKFLQFETLETLCGIVAKGNVNSAWPDSLKKFIHNANNLGLKRFPTNDLKLCQLDKEVEIGMKQKKIAEVKSTAVYIDEICARKQVTHILDFGAGQGYLSSVLAYQYGYNVIAVDSDILQTSGGEQRAKRILNLYSLHQKSVKGLLRFMTGKISIGDGFDAIFEKVESNFPDVANKKWIICGLHTCGNLAVTMLNGFKEYKRSNVVGLVNLGCCYQLLTESTNENDLVGFPLSNVMKSYRLGLHNRMVACQASQRWEDYSAIKESLKRLFYRSVLQKLLVDHNITTCGQTQSDALKSSGGEVAIKKLGTQACANPIAYTKAALERLGSQHKLEDGLVLGTFEWYASIHNQIAAIWTLRTMLANVIESLILTDRCIYMKESNFHVELIAMADPDVSPRNMAIIVTKLNL